MTCKAAVTPAFIKFMLSRSDAPGEQNLPEPAQDSGRFFLSAAMLSRVLYGRITNGKEADQASALHNRGADRGNFSAGGRHILMFSTYRRALVF